MSSRVDYTTGQLNQQEQDDFSHKWLKDLPPGVLEDSVFWNQVYDDVIRLAEILKKIKEP